jgi:hypothetical protein
MSENNQIENGTMEFSSDPSLVTPSTERAINDLITASTQHQQQQQQQSNGHHAPQQQSNGNDDFENLQRAVQILGRAKQLDEVKRYADALSVYRQGVDMLLEELMIRQGTDQSRSYLRQKCNDFMNRIDQLKLIIQIENANCDNKENQVAS